MAWCGDCVRRLEVREVHLSVLIEVEVEVASGGNALFGPLATAGAQWVRRNVKVRTRSVLIRKPALKPPDGARWTTKSRSAARVILSVSAIAERYFKCLNSVNSDMIIESL